MKYTTEQLQKLRDYIFSNNLEEEFRNFTNDLRYLETIMTEIERKANDLGISFYSPITRVGQNYLANIPKELEKLLNGFTPNPPEDTSVIYEYTDIYNSDTGEEALDIMKLFKDNCNIFFSLEKDYDGWEHSDIC